MAGAGAEVGGTARVRREGNPIIGWFADLRVVTKFLALITVLGVVALAVGVTAIVGMGSMQTRSDAMYRDNVMAITQLAKTRALALTIRGHVFNAAVSTDVKTAQGFIDKIAPDDKAFDEAFAAYTAVPRPGREAHAAAVVEGMTQWRQVRDSQMLPAALRQDHKTFAEARDNAGLAAFNKLSGGLNELMSAEARVAGESNTASKQTYQDSRRNVILILVIGLAAGIGLGMVIARLIIMPVRKVAAVLAALAHGDLTRSAEVSSRDELGQMAGALDEATTHLRGVISAVSASSQTLAGAAEELSSVNQAISASAEETSVQAHTVSAAAEQVSRNVQTVSAGSEQMGASIAEIANNASEAARVATEAVSVARSANTTVSQLGASSAEIGNVINTITSIAEQTNLLALNATIEAARAGEAGKGFAVVASEVKDLAQETAKATEDISGRIELIQRDTAAAVEAISHIGEVIEKISDYSTTIASAVEEQTATTSEISRNVSEAAAGSDEIANNITHVATAAQTTTSGVSDARGAADQLARMSSELQEMVTRFSV
jgi:methyl-accepting chemotaxis protein